jgi:hypothetical protein
MLEYADVSFILIFRLFVKPSNLKLFQDGLSAGGFDDSSLRRMGIAFFSWWVCPVQEFINSLIEYFFKNKKPGLVSDIMIRKPTIDYLEQYLLYTRLAIESGIKIERGVFLMLETIAACDETSPKWLERQNLTLT